MSYIQYIDKAFRNEALKLINLSDQVLCQFAQQGYTVTLRSLYYQLVSKNIIPNTEASYKKLGNIINDARLAGLIDWSHISDQTRNIRKKTHWNTPGDILYTAAQQYAIDLWENQMLRPEVWIEKDALVGVIADTCRKWDVTYFSCRGYVSQSEMWQASQRLIGFINNGQKPLILHFGDHDPSGIDMTRDIESRLKLFTHMEIPVVRVALTMDQIQHFNLPPNPAKITDSRSTAYIELHGHNSWELDSLFAVQPGEINRLIEEDVKACIDWSLWGVREEIEKDHRARLLELSKNWDKHFSL